MDMIKGKEKDTSAFTRWLIGADLKSSLFWIIVFLALIAAYTSLGPAEKSLGTHVRIVYLHGAWVWVSLAGFIASTVLGLGGLLARRPSLLAWSRSLGLAGLVFWVTYLPLSLWAMQANWNGLFLAEPRWRLAFVFSVCGLLLQAGLFLLNRPAWTAAANILFTLALFTALMRTPNVMHPASPILTSNVWTIKAYFGGMMLLVLGAGWQVARFIYRLDPPKP